MAVGVYERLATTVLLNHLDVRKTHRRLFKKKKFCDVFEMIPVEQLGFQHRSDLEVCNAARGETKQNLQKGER